MEDLFNVRSKFGDEFGFDTSNEISKDKKNKMTGAG